MSSHHFVRSAFLEERPRPINDVKPITRLKEAVLNGWKDTAVTVVVLLVLFWGAYHFIGWAVVQAVFRGGPEALANCRALEGIGACWPVVYEKWRLVLFGLYPYDQQWRPAIACAMILSILLASALPRLWRKSLSVAWIMTSGGVAILMWGGIANLPFVPTDSWGGLPVTLLLSTVGLACGFPLGILLALARRSQTFPALRAFAVTYIELVRAIPLLVVLFMASVMFPLFLPPDVSVSKLLRVQVAIALFAAAYLAEVIRGGLQAVPKGQEEAADAIGLRYWKKMALIVLPQAIKVSIPGIVNTFISFFKATSIVVVVGIFDLMTAAKRSVADPLWQGFGFELYLFVGAIYFIHCFSMSRYSQWLELRLNRGA